MSIHWKRIRDINRLHLVIGVKPSNSRSVDGILGTLAQLLSAKYEEKRQTLWTFVLLIAHLAETSCYYLTNLLTSYCIHSCLVFIVIGAVYCYVMLPWYVPFFPLEDVRLHCLRVVADCIFLKESFFRLSVSTYRAFRHACLPSMPSPGCVSA